MRAKQETARTVVPGHRIRHAEGARNFERCAESKSATLLARMEAAFSPKRVAQISQLVFHGPFCACVHLCVRACWACRQLCLHHIVVQAQMVAGHRALRYK